MNSSYFPRRGPLATERAVSTKKERLLDGAIRALYLAGTFVRRLTLPASQGGLRGGERDAGRPATPMELRRVRSQPDLRVPPRFGARAPARGDPPPRGPPLRSGLVGPRRPRAPDALGGGGGGRP